MDPFEVPAPMLSRHAALLPEGPGWLFEPKWDGFRALVARRSNLVTITSRTGKDLGRHFPEVMEAAALLPPGTLLDGELVMPGESGVSFARLVSRLGPSGRGEPGRASASLVAFDLLWHRNRNLMASPLTERRAELESLLAGLHRGLQVTPQTGELVVARRWLEDFAGTGIEGVVAKRALGIYRPGRRDHLKIRRLRTVDCVVMGYTGEPLEPVLVLGIHDAGGGLRVLGCSRRLHRSTALPLQPLLAMAGEPRGPLLARWVDSAQAMWKPVPAVLVCEVSCPYIDEMRFRQPAAFVRWRPDKSPAECTESQLAGAKPD